MAALGEQLAQLSIKQIQKLPVDERLIDALLEVQNISSFEARRRQFQRVGKLLRNEDETVILSYLTPQQGAKKQAQLMRWVDRMIEQVTLQSMNLAKSIMHQNDILYVSMC